MINFQDDLQLLAQEAVDENTSGDRLEEIATKSVEFSRLVASNSSTPPHLLAALANNRDIIIQENVTTNPNTPTDVLVKLGRNYPRALFANPILSLLILENPNFLYEIQHQTLVIFLKYQVEKAEFEFKSKSESYSQQITIPEFCLEILAKHPNALIRALVAKHPHTPINIIEELAQDDINSRYLVRENVARNPNAPISLLNQFAKHPAWQLRAGVARNANAPVELMEILAEDTDRFVRKGIAENTNTPIHLLEKLAKDKHSYVRYCVKNNPSTPVAISKQIF
jgi:hypothetical protein